MRKGVVGIKDGGYTDVLQRKSPSWKSALLSETLVDRSPAMAFSIWVTTCVYILYVKVKFPALRICITRAAAAGNNCSCALSPPQA